jgi:hypothetical protein
MARVPKDGSGSTNPHPARAARKVPRPALPPPPPATVAQRRELPPHPARAADPRPPHPAIVAQRLRWPPAGAVAQRGGAAATVSATIQQVTFRRNTYDARLERLGQFGFTVDFGVAPQQSGYIVQKIERTASVTAYDTRTSTARSSLSAAQIDSMSAVNPNYSDWTRYWEVFAVDTAGQSVFADDFSFSQMDMNNTSQSTRADWETDGTYRIAGTAWFYTGAPPASAFSAGNTRYPPNGLDWTKADPSGSLPAPSSVGFAHAATVTWTGQRAQTLTYTVGGVSGSQTNIAR